MSKCDLEIDVNFLFLIFDFRAFTYFYSFNFFIINVETVSFSLFL